MTNNRVGIFDVFAIFCFVRYMYAGKLVPNLPLILVDEWETSAVRNVTICGWLEYFTRVFSGAGVRAFKSFALFLTAGE